MRRISQLSSSALMAMLAVVLLPTGVVGTADIHGLALYKTDGTKVMDMQCGASYTICQGDVGSDLAVKIIMVTSNPSDVSAARLRTVLDGAPWNVWDLDDTQYTEDNRICYYTANDVSVPAPFLSTVRQTKLQVQGCKYNNCGNIANLDAFGNFCTVDLDIVAGSTDCDGRCEYVKLDFNTGVSPAQYITDELETSHYVTIHATGPGAYTPGNAARVFDSSNPGTRQNGDPDLGSPNHKCAAAGYGYPAGPGEGTGGEPGESHQNCFPVGNLLIVQEDDKPTPDDNIGGDITFTFTELAEVTEVSILDIDDNNNPARIRVFHPAASGSYEEFVSPASEVGDNGILFMPINRVDVNKVIVKFPGSGAVNELLYRVCPHTLQPSHFPTETPSGLPTAQPTAVPSKGPTEVPVPGVTPQPSVHPSDSPTKLPVPGSTPQPSAHPSEGPTMIPRTPTIDDASDPVSTPTGPPSGCPAPGTITYEVFGLTGEYNADPIDYF